MTRIDDETFVSFLREHTLSSVPVPGLDPRTVLVSSRRKRTATLAARTSAASLAIGIGVLGIVALDDPRESPAVPVSAPTTSEAPEPTPAAPPDEPSMCAEFPTQPPGGGPSYEGWWSSSPADLDGAILTDPVDWPPIVREHPQTVLIDTRTGKVIESFDRYACAPVAGYEVPPDLALPPDAVVVVDALTGEVLETMSPPAFSPQP